MNYINILNYFDLEETYNHYLTRSGSTDLPYHNAYHTQCMIEGCYEGANYFNLPFETTEKLIIAAIFHDFGHSGGKSTDTANVQVAINAMSEYFADDPTLVRLIGKIIACTEYPFVRNPMTIEERIIRDADMLQIAFPNWEGMIITGLQKEMSVAQRRDITINEMWLGQAKFHDSAKFFTSWGEEIAKDLIVTERRRTIFYKAHAIKYNTGVDVT